MATETALTRTEPVRVLLVNDHLGFNESLHGVGRYFLNIIPKFDPQCVRVFPVITHRRDRLAEPFEKRDIHIKFLGRHKFDPRTLLDLLRYIRKEKIEVVHVQGFNADILGRIAGLVTCVPVILHQRDANFLPPPYIRVLDGLLASTTNRVLAVSENVRRFTAEQRSIPLERIQVLPNGVDTRYFIPPHTF